MFGLNFIFLFVVGLFFIRVLRDGDFGIIFDWFVIWFLFGVFLVFVLVVFVFGLV